jgi:hypothetical protein
MPEFPSENPFIDFVSYFIQDLSILTTHVQFQITVQIYIFLVFKKNVKRVLLAAFKSDFP